MQAIGLARLGRDSEVRYTPNGDAVSNLSLAFSYRDKKENATQWVEGSLWGKMAESLDPYLKKGGLVFVVIDDVHIEEFESKGETRTKLTGRISKLNLAGSKSDSDGGERPAARAPAPKPTAKAPAQSHAFDDMDDDIPF